MGMQACVCVKTRMHTSARQRDYFINLIYTNIYKYIYIYIYILGLGKGLNLKCSARP